MWFYPFLSNKKCCITGRQVQLNNTVDPRECDLNSTVQPGFGKRILPLETAKSDDLGKCRDVHNLGETTVDCLVSNYLFFS